jgi:hypothetical protein
MRTKCGCNGFGVQRKARACTPRVEVLGDLTTQSTLKARLFPAALIDLGLFILNVCLTNLRAESSGTAAHNPA